MKKYLLFVSHSYSYSILRPIQKEIRNRGEDVAWFIEDSCPLYLRDNEKHLKTIKEVMEYNPVAIYAPGNYIYDFFPGVKVEVFHGLFYKRSDYGDHYRIRGFFDLYCTTSSMFTPHFKELENKYGFFKVVETGWSKFDSFIPDKTGKEKNENPVILYAPTFTANLTSADALHDKIEELLQEKDWQWIFSFHPKMDEINIRRYKLLAEKYNNAIFSETEDKLDLFRKADIMLSDTSSVIYEFLWFDKPAVTFKNTFPDKHLIDINSPEDLQTAIEKGLKQPIELMENIHNFMNIVHPFRDGRASARILDATDDFIKNYQGKIRKKPINLLRKLKLRKKAGYFPFGPYYKTSN